MDKDKKLVIECSEEEILDRIIEQGRLPTAEEIIDEVQKQ